MTIQSTAFSEKPRLLPSLPLNRPLLMIGHGTRDIEGKKAFLDFADAYQALDASRPVIPCFLELTEPPILEGVKHCIEKGFTDVTALPILLFAARHTKFDVTQALDLAKRKYPSINFFYGRHFGNTPYLLDLWRSRLSQLDQQEIQREETVLLVIGRGSSDPDANSDVYKFSRLLWEGSHYKSVETCFIGITHPRLEEGFRRARLFGSKRIIVLPHFLFTGALVKKIFRISAHQQVQFPETEIVNLPEIGFTPELITIVREREIESQLGQTVMNCEMCKFRQTTVTEIVNETSHHHHHGHHHHSTDDPYRDLEQYHSRIWQVP